MNILSRRAWLTRTALAASAVASAVIALPGCVSLRTAQPWVMPSTRYLDLAAAPLPDSFSPRQHRLMLYIPDGQAPASGYPVIYVLDGSLMFPLVAQLLHNRGARGLSMRGDSAVVVGLGHVPPPDSHEIHDRAARTYDYTPPYSGGAASSQGQAQGGADVFLDFLARQVQPLVASQLPVDMRRQTLVGHSLGGLCVLHALLTRPGMFQRHVSGSPSLWWGGGQVWDAVADFVVRRAVTTPEPLPPLSLHLSRGSEEQAVPNHPERWEAIRLAALRGSLADLPERLAPVVGLSCDYTVWPGANHGGAQPFVSMQAVRVALS